MNTYDEYGIPRSSNAGRFQYTGQTWVPELGMYYFKARIYSPTLGRFLQADPAGFRGGVNWYSYVGADPVNNVDPWGLKTKTVTAKGGPGDGLPTLPPDGKPHYYGDGKGNIGVYDNNGKWTPVNTVSGDLVGTLFVGTGAALAIMTGGLSEVAEGGGAAAEAAAGEVAAGETGAAAEEAEITVTGQKARSWTFGSSKSVGKWEGQMASRGWTEEEIDEAIQEGEQFASPNNLRPSNGATRYVNPRNGHSVVIDNITKEIIHVGGDGFQY